MRIPQADEEEHCQKETETPASAADIAQRLMSNPGSGPLLPPNKKPLRRAAWGSMPLPRDRTIPPGGATGYPRGANGGDAEEHDARALANMCKEDAMRDQRQVMSEVGKKELKPSVKVYSNPGSVWQVDPPHLLQYSPGDVHLYGWIPFADWRPGQGRMLTTIVAGVVSSWGLHVQCVLLVGWTFVLHMNVLGLPLTAQYHLLKIFSTNWMGSIFNLSTVVSPSCTVNSLT